MPHLSPLRLLRWPSGEDASLPTRLARRVLFSIPAFSPDLGGDSRSSHLFRVAVPDLCSPPSCPAPASSPQAPVSRLRSWISRYRESPSQFEVLESINPMYETLAACSVLELDQSLLDSMWTACSLSSCRLSSPQIRSSSALPRSLRPDVNKVMRSYGYNKPTDEVDSWVSTKPSEPLGVYE